MKAPTMHVKPADGLLVPYPGRGNRLATGGEEVPRITYWMRRLARGDVVEIGAEAQAPEPAQRGGRRKPARPKE